MNATSTLNADAAVKLVLETMFVEAPKQSALMLWNLVLIPILSKCWLPLGLLLFTVFLVVTTKAMLGRWGSLGSFLYNFFYFGTLVITGLIWGSEIFVNDVMNFFTALILYPICYLLVGWILENTGFKRR